MDMWGDSVFPIRPNFPSVCLESQEEIKVTIRVLVKRPKTKFSQPAYAVFGLYQLSFPVGLRLEQVFRVELLFLLFKILYFSKSRPNNSPLPPKTKISLNLLNLTHI